MSRRTTKAYQAVFDHIKGKFPSFLPKTAMSDFEKALMKAIRLSFSDIKVVGCHFHFSQVKFKLK